MLADKLYHKHSTHKLPGLKFETDKKETSALNIPHTVEDVKPEKFKIRILNKSEGFRKYIA